MLNEERRVALAQARREALHFAERAMELYRDGHVHTGMLDLNVKMSRMWADVGNVMKIGEAGGDGVIT